MKNEQIEYLLQQIRNATILLCRFGAYPEGLALTNQDRNDATLVANQLMAAAKLLQDELIKPLSMEEIKQLRTGSPLTMNPGPMGDEKERFSVIFNNDRGLRIISHKTRNEYEFRYYMKEYQIYFNHMFPYVGGSV